MAERCFFDQESVYVLYQRFIKILLRLFNLNLIYYRQIFGTTSPDAFHRVRWTIW